MEYIIERNGRELTPLINYTESNYMPKPYEVPKAISKTHEQPRFGRTNDIGALINGSEQVDDYILGIIIGAMIILIVAIVWFFAVVCLKIAGQKRVGFLAGRLTRPSSANSSQGTDEDGEKGAIEVVMENDDDGGSNEERVDEAVLMSSTMNNSTNESPVDKNFNRRVWAVRGVFVLSGLLVIISGGLFYGKGVVAFADSINQVSEGIDLVQIAAYKGIDLTESVLKEGSRIEEEMEPTQETMATNGNGQICGLTTDVSTQISDTYDQLTTSVDNLKTMLGGQLGSFNHDLKRVIALTDEINKNLEYANIFLYTLIAISVIIISLIITMLVGVFFAWKGISNCLTKFIQFALLWPLFIFFLILSWIFATLFLVFSLAGADFCVSPDQYVQAILDKDADMFDGIIFGFVVFYVSGCTIIPAGAEDIMDIAGQVKLVVTNVHALTEILGGQTADQIALICGLTTAQAAALQSLIVLMHDITHVLNNAVVGLREVLSCETFNPIYTTFVHEAFCVEGVSGLTYIFSTTIVISIFSMVMIMFRAALYPIKEPDAQPLSKSEDAIEVVKYDENENVPAAEESAAPVPVIY